MDSTIRCFPMTVENLVYKQKLMYLLKLYHDIFGQFHVFEHALQFAGKSSTTFCHTNKKKKAKIPQLQRSTEQAINI